MRHIPPLCLALLLAACGPVHYFQPNVPQGGRAVSIAVRPGSSQQMFVASETGGLFSTGNGGETWVHIRSLPSYSVSDVAYAPGDRNVLIATGYSDYRNANGPIWRSADHGASWSRPATSTPPAGPRCPARPSGYSVAFEPGAPNVYVGTDCGVALSRDLGLTWTHVVPDPTVPANGERTQNRVWSVFAQAGGRLNLSAQDGLWFSGSAGGSWTKATTGPGYGQAWVHHAFAASPFEPRHLFHAGGWYQLFVSLDSGANWTQVAAPSRPGRPAFVRTAHAVSGEADKFDVYFGDGVDISRQTYTHAAAGPVGTGTWTRLTSDHADPADIAFDVANRAPVLLASDGGVHRTRDGGASWTLTGGGTGGFNALQITEVTGQAVSGAAAHQDLYYGTQDNDVVASADGGVTWPNPVRSEGFYLRTGATSVDHAGVKITGVRCWPCTNFISDPHLSNVADWPNPPDDDADPLDVDGNPFLIRQSHYLQNTINHDATPLANTFRLTTNTGGTWSVRYEVPQELRGIPTFGPPGASVTAYQPVRRPGATADGLERIGLLKITDVEGPGAATVMDADVDGLGGLGIFRTMFAWYTVLGVDPKNPERLIAPDIETDEMKYSIDGGRHWYVDHELTDKVTGGGAFRFRIERLPLVHAISFDPVNSCHILVGTAHNGILRSTDGGSTWRRVRRSERITNLSSFYFPPSGKVVVSSYGRGLWKLDVRRGRRACRPLGVPPPGRLRPRIDLVGPTVVADPMTGALVQLRDLGDPEVCPACEVVLVRNGRITWVELDGLQVLRFGMSGGSAHQLQGLREVPLTVPNVYSTTAEARPVNEVLSMLLERKAPIRGLLIDGGMLEGIVISEKELPYQPVRIPYVFLTSHDTAGGTVRVDVGGRLTVHGEGFAGGEAVAVRIDGEPVAEDVKVDADGRFTVQVEVRKSPGEYDVVVEQNEGVRASRDTSRVKVVPRDEREPIYPDAVAAPPP